MVDDVFATMSFSAFQMLSTYTDSPSVVYVGKMWKRAWMGHSPETIAYYLCWYDHDPGKHGLIVVRQRRIILK